MTIKEVKAKVTNILTERIKECDKTYITVNIILWNNDELECRLTAIAYKRRNV